MLCRIYEGQGPLDALSVRDWLQRNGIRAFVIGGAHTNMRRGDWRWPSVYVLDTDREAARCLIVTSEEMHLFP